MFSGAASLNAIAIIVAALAFGGFWSVFFAIPLATHMKAVYNALPSKGDKEVDEPPASEGLAATED